MAVRTIAAGGGNFNATGTWVEGIVPVSTDHIVGDSSSGQLTVNANATIQYIDMTGYTNTLTFNAGNVLTIQSGTTTTLFGSGTTFAGTGVLSVGTGTQTFRSSTTSRIPVFRFAGASGNKTMGTNIYCEDLEITGSGIVINSNKIFIGGDYTYSNTGSEPSGTVTLEFDGTGTANHTSNNNAKLAYVVNTTGTTTFNNFALTTGSFTQTAGTIARTAGGQGLSIFHFTGTATINTLSGASAPSVSILMSDTGNRTLTITTSAPDYYFNTLSWYHRTNSSGVKQTIFNKNLNCDNLVLGYNVEAGGRSEIRLQAGTGFTHNIDRIFVAGDPIGLQSDGTSNTIIRSSTNGQIAYLTTTNQSPLFFTRVIDIDASAGAQLRTYEGSVSNCTNVVSYTGDIFSASTSGGGSFTFVN